MLAGALTDWPRFMNRCLENLAPGGWLELADITFPTLSDDGTLTDTAPLSQWNKHVIEAGHRLNHSIECAKHYKQQMIDAGFVNVQEKLYKWPINSWPKDAKYKEIGECCFLSRNRRPSYDDCGIYGRPFYCLSHDVFLFLSLPADSSMSTLLTLLRHMDGAKLLRWHLRP